MRRWMRCVKIIGKNKKNLVVGENIVYYPLEERLKHELSLLYICQLNKELTEEKSNELKSNLSKFSFKYSCASQTITSSSGNLSLYIFAISGFISTAVI